MVRLLRRSDVAEVVAGWNRCLRYDRISAEKFERTIFEDPNYEGAGNLVAVKNQQVIGFIAAVAREGTVGRDGIGTAEEQEFGYIKGMFVLSEHQEEQTKHSLLTRALEYLQSKGKRTAKIGQYTGSYFSPGIDGRYRKELTFFRKNDFKEVDAEEDVMVDLKSFTPTDYQKQAQARVAELGIIITRYRPEFLSWMRRFVRRIDYPQWFPQGWELRFRKNNSHRCVALRKSEIVGWARFFKDPAGWWFGPIAVLDQFRRMGIGTCLLLQSMLQMKVLGAPNVTAGWANVPFYAKNGWRTSRRYAVLQKAISVKPTIDGIKAGCSMNTVIVDIDGTLIDTRQRMHKLWTLLLDREIPKDAAETMSLEQIFMKFATRAQLSRVKEFQQRFWDLLLCLDEAGVESFQLHEPMPYAADILQSWSGQSELVYLTGRTENTRALTLNELKRFDFPTEHTKLVMFKPEDYARPKGENPLGPTLIDTRARLGADICKNANVVRVIDDYPGYFPILQQLEIPDRIGFLHAKKYQPQHYLDKGATRVVESWKALQDDPPNAA